MAWTNLTNHMSGTIPEARLRMGFTSANGSLYVFGGKSAAGPCFPKLEIVIIVGKFRSFCCRRGSQRFVLLQYI